MKGHSTCTFYKDGFSTTNHQLPPNESSTNKNLRDNEPKIKHWICSDDHRLMD